MEIEKKPTLEQLIQMNILSGRVALYDIVDDKKHKIHDDWTIDLLESLDKKTLGRIVLAIFYSEDEKGRCFEIYLL